MSNTKVSIVLTIYNDELYLKECLDSILNQTLKELQLICINSSSTDNSAQILKKYAQSDDRITIVNREHNTLANARNIGLSLAYGEYVYFLTPDNFIELNLLELSYNKANLNDLDVVIFGCNFYNNTTKVYSNSVCSIPNGIKAENIHCNEIFSYKDMTNTLFNTFANVVCNRLFKTSFLKENNLCFNKLNQLDDLFLINYSLIISNKISVINEVLVYNRIGKSIEHISQELNPIDIFTALKMLKTSMLELGKYKELKKSFIIFIVSNAIDNLNLQETYDDFKIVYEYISDLLDKEFDILKNKDYFYNETDYEKTLFEKYNKITTMSVDNYLKLSDKYFVNVLDKSPKVSVIIPIYNVEMYLRDCLDSVLNQTLFNIEIICINDGSTDDSMQILLEYVKKDNRITIVNHDNKGLSFTRNKGIHLAKGQYIHFLDADDILVSHALETMYIEASNKNLDILFFNCTTEYETLELKTKFSKLSNQNTLKFDSIVGGDELLEKINFIDNTNLLTNLSLIRTDFLINDNILFNEFLMLKDSLFELKLLVNAKRVASIEQELYIKLIRENSIITSKINYEKFYSSFISYIDTLEYTRKIILNLGLETTIGKIIDNMQTIVVNEFKSLTEIDKGKLYNLNNIEKHYFETFVVNKVYGKNIPKLEFIVSNINTDKLQKDLTLAKKEINKYKGQIKYHKSKVNKYIGQVKYHKNDKINIKKSKTYRIGRMVTWFPRKLKNLIK